MSERPGDVLHGRYRLERRVGVGGASDVWVAADERLERPVAVKVVRLDPDDAAAAQRGPAEARLLGGLTHRNLVPLYDARFPADPGEGPAYLVMELVEGGTLAQALASGPVPPDRARVVVGEVAAALAYLHARGVIHRDVKPANILFARDGTAKLTDFGIARVLGSPGLTQTGMLLGTAPYLSPEQVRGAPPTPASDVYALGLVLLEALTATRAYPGTPTESALARLTRRPHVPPALPADLRSLLDAMLADAPEARPRADQVALALGQSTASPAPTAVLPPAGVPTAVLPPAGVPTAVVARPRRPAAAWLAVPLAAVVALVVGILSLTGGGGSPDPIAPSPSAVVAAHTGPAAAASTVTPTTSPAAPPPGPAAGPAHPAPPGPGPGAANDHGHGKGHDHEKGGDG